MSTIALIWAIITKAGPIIKQATEVYEEVEKAREDDKISKDEVAAIFKDVLDLLVLLFPKFK